MNGVSVINHSLQFAVQQLVAVPMGGVAKIGVCHPLPVTPDINSDLSSPLTGSHGSVIIEDDQEEEDEDEEEGSIDNVSSILHACSTVMFMQGKGVKGEMAKVINGGGGGRYQCECMRRVTHLAECQLSPSTSSVMLNTFGNG